MTVATAASGALDRRPATLPGPSFARGLWRIAAADVSCGNEVRLLRDGPATFAAMLGMIEEARTSVEFEEYIFRADEVGLRFAAAITAAAKRGVRVRLLVDWFGRRGTSRAFFRRLRADGVDVRTFNPFGLHSWLGLIPRDHRKVLVVDGRVGVTGGIGIGVEWQRGVLRRRRSPWRDTAVQITGEGAADMLRAFERMWTRVEAGRPPREERRLQRSPLRGHLDPAFDPPALVGIIEGEPGRLRVSRALQLQSVAAQRTIWIASAYFVPSMSQLEALAGAARDGVDVRVLVPSRYDHPWVRRLTTHFYRRLIRNGVRIWEWPGEMMHAKTSVIDGRWVRVGSTDFNPLGVAINFELDAVIEDERLGGDAEAMFLEDLARSREIRLAGRLARLTTGTSADRDPSRDNETDELVVR